MDCGRYDGFVSTHTLLEPLTKGHPFELVVVNTPPAESKGRYHKNWPWMYTQRGWVTKLKSMATRKQSRKGHGNICNLFTASKKLLVDEGPEFHNKELTEECTKRGTKLEIFPSCSPASLGVRTQSSWIVWSEAVSLLRDSYRLCFTRTWSRVKSSNDGRKTWTPMLHVSLTTDIGETKVFVSLPNFAFSRGHLAPSLFYTPMDNLSRLSSSVAICENVVINTMLLEPNWVQN